MAESPLLLIPHIIQAQFQKEVTANQAINLLERAIAEVKDLDAAGTGTLTLSNDEARSAAIRLTGALTGNKTVTVPARSKFYLFENATTGDFELDVKTASGTAVRIKQGSRVWILCDGVDCFDLVRDIWDLLETVTVAYTIQDYDRVIVGDTTSGGFTVTLPAPKAGKSVLIMKEGGVNTLTIAPAGSDTINGAGTSKTITTQYEAILLTGVSGTAWVAHRLTVA